MENLTPFKRDKICCYCNSHRGLVLKEYENSDSRALRILNIFPKGLVHRIIGNDIVEIHQPRIMGLNRICPEDRPAYMNRLLMIRRVDELPFDCILSRDNARFSNGKMLRLGQTVNLFRSWIQINEQYDEINPAHFLLDLRSRLLNAFEVIDAQFPTDLELLSLKVNLGIKVDEDNGEVIPVWTGEGVIPQTAEIMENELIVKDPFYLAKKILPEKVYLRQVGGLG
jgi:hypothetical protein